MAEITSAWDGFSSFSNTDFGNNVAWSNVQNFAADDNVLASVTLVSGSQISKYATATHWNGKQSISPDSVINGIEVRYAVWRDAVYASGSNEQSLRLVSDGAVIGTDHATQVVYGATEALYTRGSTSDNWGIAADSGSIRNGAFGSVLAVQTAPGGATVLYGDYIQMRLTQSPGNMMMCM